MKNFVFFLAGLVSFFGTKYVFSHYIFTSSYNFKKIDKHYQKNFASFRIIKKEFPNQYRNFIEQVEKEVNSENSFNKGIEMGARFFNKLALINQERLFNVDKENVDSYFKLTKKFIEKVHKEDGGKTCLRIFSDPTGRAYANKDFLLKHQDIMQEIAAKKIIYYSNKNKTDSIPIKLLDVQAYLLDLNSKYPEILPSNQHPNKGDLFCEKLSAFYLDLINDKSPVGYQSKKFLFLLENKIPAEEIGDRYAVSET